MTGTRPGDGADPAPDVAQDVARRTKLLVGVFVVVSNAIGAAVVLALAGWVLPFRALVADEAEALRTNLVLLAVYAPVAGAVAFVVGWRWMRIPAAPGPESTAVARERYRRRARRVVLRAPLRLAVVQGCPWVLGVVVFAAVNAQWSPTLAVAVSCVIALGGITTVTVAFRFCELAVRGEVARVFVVQPPADHRVPGVAVRSLGAWLAGTGVPLFGVLLTAATSLVYADYYTVTRLGLVTLVLAAVALAVGFLVTALSSTSIAASVTAVRRGLQRVERGDLASTVRVTDTTELGLLQSGFNTMVAGLRERDRVRELFGRQVGHDVATAAVDGPAELGGEVREVAVLFVDLVGSTRMAAEEPPAEVVARLNGFFAEVVEVVESCGGWINKFEGDAALAVFGAPVATADPATGALAAARTLAERFAGDRASARAGIGVSAGEAVAGNIGAARRYEYTVIGDPVNEASRLCDLAKAMPARVAASGSALDRAGGDEAGRWTVLGELRLRGRPAETAVAVPSSRAAGTRIPGARPTRAAAD